MTEENTHNPSNQNLFKYFLIMFAVVAASIVLKIVIGSSKSEQKGEQLSFNNPCNIQSGVCSFKFENSVLDLEINPLPIVQNQPIEISLTSSDKSLMQKLSNVSLKLEGKEMDMGINQPIINSLISNGLKGETTLPQCSSPQMTWIATLYFGHLGKEYWLNFEFITKRIVSKAIN